MSVCVCVVNHIKHTFINTSLYECVYVCWWVCELILNKQKKWVYMCECINFYVDECNVMCVDEFKNHQQKFVLLNVSGNVLMSVSLC